jgi:hypothetical protein
MAEQGDIVPQGLVEKDLPGVLSVHSWSSPRRTWVDSHLGVIDDNGEVVGRVSVGTLDDQIVQFLDVEGDIPFDEVFHHRDARVGAPETDHGVRGPGQAFVPAGAVVIWVSVPGPRLTCAFRRALPVCRYSK